MSAAEKIVEYDLERDMYRLLLDEPFFAGVSRYVSKIPSTAIPSAGVRITDDGNFELMYNPQYMASLSDNHKLGILMHEFYHLIFEHCFHRSPDGKKISLKWNLATDMSINCHIKRFMPEDSIFPQKFGYEDGLSAEQYFAKLPDDPSGGKCNGQHAQGEGQGDGPSCDGSCGNKDSHDGWGESGELGNDLKEMAKERLKDMMRKAAEEANKRSDGWGSVSAETKRAVMRLINSTIDWRAVLRAFIGQAQRSNKSNTVKRINRRYPYIHPGRKTNRSAHIAISIDQSGSVDDELLSLFFSELDGLSKLATFTVIPFDDRVGESKIYTWKKGQRHNCERVLCGGTNFDAPTQYVNDHTEYDGHIILTDMCAPAPKPSRVRRMWMTDTRGYENPYFKTNERVLVVKRKKD